MKAEEKHELIILIGAFKKMGEADRQRAHLQETQFEKGWVAGAAQTWLSAAEELEEIVKKTEMGQTIKGMMREDWM